MKGTIGTAALVVRVVVCGSVITLTLGRRGIRRVLDGIYGLRPQFGRRDVGQLPYLAGHVGLVEEATCERLPPPSRWPGQRATNAASRSNRTILRDELRRQPHGVAVARNQPPMTPAQFAGQA